MVDDVLTKVHTVGPMDDAVTPVWPGHLGLVCSTEVYLSLIPDTNGTPYDRPDNPGRLNIAVDNLTQYQIAQAKEDHSEATRVFREVNSVERTII